MNFDITLPERMVLESLHISSKNMEELTNCTGLQYQIVQNILSILVVKNLITTKEYKYALNSHLNNEMLQELNNKENKKIELEYLLKTLINEESDKSLSLRKVSMNQREEKIYKGLLYNVESFLDSLEIKIEVNLKDQQLIFWGENTYGKAINHILNH